MNTKIKPFKYYPILLVLVVTIQMACFFLSKRQIYIFGITINGSGILFPFDIYLFEIIGYCYGYEHSRQAVWINIFVHFGFFIITYIIKNLPYPPTMHKNYIIAYKTIFEFSNYMILGSLVGEISGDFFSAILVPFSKVKFNGKFAGLLIFSTHEISAFLVASLAYLITYIPDGYSILEISHLIFGTMVIKTLIALIMLPFIKILINLIKSSENLEVFDNNQNYSLFRFNPDFNKLKLVNFRGNYEAKKNLLQDKYYV